MNQAADPKPSRPAIICILIFISCCFLSTARLLVRTPLPARLHDQNAVAQRSDLRFSSLKQALPERAVVGYIGEPGNAALGDYYLAQYALAPVIVENSTNHPFVVGNFPHLAPPSDIENLRLLRDFGSGVLLYASKGNR